jgi:hypothetical protein
LASSIIARPPAAWTVSGLHRQRQSAHRLGDRVGDVVELEVQEDRQAELRHLVDAVEAVGAVEFEAKLNAADMVADPAGKVARGGEIDHVEGQKDRPLHIT